MAELQRDLPLFDQALPVEIIDPQSHEPRQLNLVIRVLQGTQPSPTIPGQSERIYHFEVTAS